MDRPSAHRALFVAALYVMASGLVFFLFLNWNGTFGAAQGPGTFLSMVDGTAAKPFVYRTLTPSVIGAVAAAVPAPVKERTRELFGRTGWLGTFFHTDYSFELVVAIPLMYGCFLAFPFVLRKLLAAVAPGAPLAGDVAPAVGLLFLPLFFVYNHYVYDPSTILIWALAALFLLTKRYPLFYVMFTLAAFNKETSILLLPVFLVASYQEMRRPLLAGHLAALALIWLAAKAYVTMRFAANPGGFVEFHLFDHNLDLFSHPLALAYFLAVAGLFAVLAASGWRETPAAVRRSLLVILAAQATLALFFGYVDELRQYYEATPFLFLLGVSAVRKFYGRA